MRWLFPGTEVRIDATCLHSGEPIVIRMRDEELIEVSPQTAVGHMRVPFSAIRSGEAGIGFA